MSMRAGEKQAPHFIEEEHGELDSRGTPSSVLARDASIPGRIGIETLSRHIPQARAWADFAIAEVTRIRGSSMRLDQ
jgi:hypothetical protein